MSIQERVINKATMRANSDPGVHGFVEEVMAGQDGLGSFNLKTPGIGADFRHSIANVASNLQVYMLTPGRDLEQRIQFARQICTIREAGCTPEEARLLWRAVSIVVRG